MGLVRAAAVLLATSWWTPCTGFVPHTPAALRPQRELSARSPAPVQSSFFNFGGAATSTTSIPRSIKDGVTAMRQALQQALRAKTSRMEIILPRGVALGVEAPTVDKGATPVERADRELGRLFVEMFQPVIESTVIAFPDARQAQKAESIWGPECKVKVISFDEVKKKGAAKKKGRAGFGDSDALKVLPPSTEVLIVVAPGPRELTLIRKLSENFGMETCIIILNTMVQEAGGISQDDKDYLVEAFETVFHLRPVAAPTIKTTDNMLLYRAFPGEWVFAQKGVGAPRIMAKKETPFTMNELLDLLEEGKKYNDLNVLDKVKTSLFG